MIHTNDNILSRCMITMCQMNRAVFWILYREVYSQIRNFCVLAPAYTSLCRGLEYLLKVRYIIVVDLNGARFLIFEAVFLGRSATLPYV